MKLSDKVFVAGHRGLAGSAVVRAFKVVGHNVLTAERAALDLENKSDVDTFFHTHRPDYVVMCAAKVGGIVANQNSPVDFFVKNISIQNNILEAAFRTKVEKLLFLGSACAYPKLAPTPIREDSLLTGPLEPSNELYALAKIAGIKLCDAYRKQHGCNFISAMPTNLFGAGDHYSLDNSHVIPGMIKKFHEARGKDKVTLWGTGSPTREFLFSEDLAAALWVLMDRYDEAGTVNIGTRIPVRLSDLAALVAEIVGFTGEIVWDTARPDGTPDRAMNSDKIFNMGWAPLTPLPTGLEAAYQDFLCRTH